MRIPGCRIQRSTPCFVFLAATLAGYAHAPHRVQCRRLLCGVRACALHIGRSRWQRSALHGAGAGQSEPDRGPLTHAAAAGCLLADPPERDRCILGKGHSCIAQYIMLAEGVLSAQRARHVPPARSILGGHPEIKVPGVEASTGALGIGAAGWRRTVHAAGMGNGRAFAISGDGEINGGSVWEAALAASKHHLGNLTLLRGELR